MIPDPIFHREQAALGRKRDIERRRAELQQQRADLERQAGEAMLTQGAITREIRQALQDVRDDLQAAEYACEAASTAVEVARMEDLAETTSRDLAYLRQLLSQREAAARDLQQKIDGLTADARRLRAVDEQVLALVGGTDAVQTDSGWMVHPCAESLRMPPAERLAAAFQGANVGAEVARESDQLLGFYEAAAPQFIAKRKQLIAFTAIEDTPADATTTIDEDEQ